MAKRWSELTLEEAVERAKGISRQALHIAIRAYTKSGRMDVVEQLLKVRKELKRDKRIEKVGKDVVESTEALRATRAARIKEFEAVFSKPVDSEGRWSVTCDGRIWSHTHCKWLKPAGTKPSKTSKKRYLTIGRGSDSMLIHRVVALAFLPNPENRRNVRHKDGNTSNNEVGNLEWWGKQLDSDKT